MRPALAASVTWSLLVWWFGEGLGGLLIGGDIMGGAPGAVLLYAMLAVLLWPPRKHASTDQSTDQWHTYPNREQPQEPSDTQTARPGTAANAAHFVAEHPLGVVAAKTVWVVLWASLAVLNLQATNLAPGALHDTVSGMGAGQPAWINGAVEAFTSLSEGNGTWLTIIGTVLLLFIAAAGLADRSWQRAAVIAAIVSSVFVWLFGQALGAPFGGQATDPNSGPLLILIAMAYWPVGRVPSRQKPGAAQKVSAT